MMPSRSAATALHMYAPMLVVDVCTSVVPSACSWSVGSPLRVSTIATNDAQVAGVRVSRAWSLSSAGAAQSSEAPSGE